MPEVIFKATWKTSLNAINGILIPLRTLLRLIWNRREAFSFEYNKLKSRLETLQKSQRYFMGEEIATLSFKELQQLEQRLDNALRKIRSRKNKLMFASITDHQRKEKALQEENNDLKKQIKVMELTLSLSEQHVQNSPSLPPLETLPIPNISPVSPVMDTFLQPTTRENPDLDLSTEFRVK
ncbi:hypothetical protein IFM89_023143 [Coptis chinensis]|uniref:K-box domain-containing protein n=1 Tax=Coptis chinensis TaxID=261450 RepID=A0A835H8B8_9MAGN|nr:hypothetical protein IFM89_023143 [Coptis chinensis]